MRMHLWALGLLACGAPPPVGAPDSAVLDAALDAGAACEEPARACPEEPPYTGAPCEGALVCTYDDAAGTEARCEDGRWSVVATCPGCVPPLAEYCSTPFMGTLPGATVFIGPPGESRPFHDGEEAQLIIGAQGSPMVAFSLHVRGVESPPDCVSRGIALAWDDGDEIASPTSTGVRLHCGSSLAILLIPPGIPCDGGAHDLHLRVPVDGIGEASARLRVTVADCRG